MAVILASSPEVLEVAMVPPEATCTPPPLLPPLITKVEQSNVPPLFTVNADGLDVLVPNARAVPVPNFT